MEGATPGPSASRDKEADCDSMKGRNGLYKTFDTYEPTSLCKNP